MRELAGRVERVQLTRELRKGTAVGNLNGLLVNVANGAPYVPGEALVRFDLRDEAALRGRAPMASFISLYSPEIPRSLGFDEYIHYATWTHEMESGIEIPRKEEIWKYFAAGSMNFYFFLMDRFTNNQGKYKVNRRGEISSRKSTLPRIIRAELPDPRHSTRVLVGEGDDSAERIREEIERQGMVALELESLV